MSDVNEAERLRCIEHHMNRGDVIQVEDGFYVYWPTSSAQGFLRAHHLRWMADELDRLNKPWDDALEQYMREHP